jgi:hypothetical protein
MLAAPANIPSLWKAEHPENIYLLISVVYDRRYWTILHKVEKYTSFLP